MVIAKHGDEGASHAVTYYAVVETAGQKLTWLSLKPVTGRTHQLRAHMDHIGHPIVGDPKYFNKENWELPGGIAEQAAPPGPEDRHSASARRHDRRHRAAAAAHAAVLEPARLRRQALRSDRRSAGGGIGLAEAGCRAVLCEGYADAIDQGLRCCARGVLRGCCVAAAAAVGAAAPTTSWSRRAAGALQRRQRAAPERLRTDSRRGAEEANRAEGPSARQQQLRPADRPLPRTEAGRHRRRRPASTSRRRSTASATA